MNIKRFTLLSLVALVATSLTFLLSSTKNPSYFPEDLTPKGEVSSASGYLNYLRSIKVNKVTGEIDPNEVFAAKKHISGMPKSKASLGLSWNFRGPDNVGGRTRALLIDKDNPDHLYAGGVSGGLFVSTNGGSDWQPYEGENYDNNVIYISTITQSPNGDIYVGTGGHFEGGGFGTTSPSQTKDSYFLGSGIYKLTGDGGYQPIITPQNRSNNSDYITIGELTADPLDNNKLHVAANQGYRVIEIDPNDFSVTESTPISTGKANDVQVSDDGQTVIVTTNGRLYTSVDGGNSFTPTLQNSGWSRIECAIAPSDNNIVYASAVKSSGGTDAYCLAGVFRSSDRGQNWERISPEGSATFDMFSPGGNFGCQGYYDNFIAVYPDDAGKIVVGGITLYRWVLSSESPINGSWNGIDITTQFTANGGLIDSYVHADKHAMAFDPRNSDVAYIATDGGITKSTNFNDEQPTYRASNYKYGVTQYYGMDVNGNDIMLGGTQDNGTHLIGVEYNNNLGGLQVVGGDGFDSEMSLINSSVGIGTLYYNQLFRVQGIGTSTGNSNLSTANIVNTNTFMSAVCASVDRCSRSFYSAIELWESFNHHGSTDSVENVFFRYTLPPIKANTVLAFESNNNDILQFDTVGVKNGSFDVVSVQNGQLDANGDLYPSDTIIDETNNNTYPLTAFRNGKVVNYDTIFVDTSNLQIFVNDFEGGSNSYSFTYGADITFNNVFANAANGSQHQMRVSEDANTGEISVRVREFDFQFRYIYYTQDKVQSILASANWPGRGGDYSESNVFITRDVLKNSTDIVWHMVAGANSTPDEVRGEVLDMTFSNDGNHLFIGTTNGDLYRVSDLDSVDTDLPQSASGSQIYDIVNNQLAGKCRRIRSFPGAITSISIDPNNSDNMVVTLGNYGNFPKAWITNQATTVMNPSSATAFVRINGDGAAALPSAPTYASTIKSQIDEVNNDTSYLVLLGTEFGLFASDNVFEGAANVTWTQENEGLGEVPVFEVVQMNESYESINKIVLDSISILEGMINTPEEDSVIINEKVVYGDDVVDSVRASLVSRLIPLENAGAIYVATHGKGIYRADQLVSIPEIASDIEMSSLKMSFNVYPNPTVNIANIKFNTRNITENVLIQVYSISGQMVKETSFNNVQRGDNVMPLNISELDQGAYIVRAIQGDEMVSTKILKR